MSFIAAVAALILMGGVALIVWGSMKTPVRERASRPGLSEQIRTSRARYGNMPALALVGFGLGLLVFLVSGWLVAVVIMPVAFVGLPWLLSKNNTGTSIERLEAMEEWTRSLAGVLTVGVGLEQALLATQRSTPEAIKPEVDSLVSRLRARWQTDAAIRAFAADLDDPTGDVIAASLLLGANRRGAGLASVLEGLAKSVADDVRVRRQIEADRAKPRTTAKLVTIITVGILVLFALSGSYIAPYGTPTGQVLLAVLLGAYAGCLLWLRHLTRGKSLPRLIGVQSSLDQELSQRSDRQRQEARS